MRAFDIESLLSQIYGEKKKLVEWAEFFGVNVAKFQTHKSVDDAMMTMLCFKRLCEQQGKSPETILAENKGLFVTSEQILIQAQERAYKKEMLEKIKRLYGKKSPKPRYKTVLDRRFEFDRNILHDVDTAFELIKRIYDNGGTVFEHLTGNGEVIFTETPPAAVQEKLKKRGLKTVTEDELFEA